MTRMDSHEDPEVRAFASEGLARARAKTLAHELYGEDAEMDPHGDWQDMNFPDEFRVELLTLEVETA